MLRQIHAEAPMLPIKDAEFPSPFHSELEYSCPARGTWNIVHTGFLVPQAHEIFVCAAGCLRGVVLTAAEAGIRDRFSTIEIREHNVLEGDLEELIIDGVADILAKLPYKPKAVLLYTSCIHHFVGSDLPGVYKTLRERFPDIDFTDCYMNPIMRKSGLNPEQTMRRQVYSLLHTPKTLERKINIIGNNIPVDKQSELFSLAELAGVPVTEITDCKTYDEYQAMAYASLNITVCPTGAVAGDYLEKRFGQQHLYLPQSFDYAEITACLNRLAAALELPVQEYANSIARCEEALEHAHAVIGGAPIVIDYTAVMRPLGLAKLLLTHGFRVEAVYADSYIREEREDFRWLQEHCPGLRLYPTVHPTMRVQPRLPRESLLSIGQKAAYFNGASHFINMVEGGGLYGFTGIVRLCELLTEAWQEPKDARKLIQIKGWECGCI